MGSDWDHRKRQTGNDSFHVDPAEAYDGEIKPIMSPYESAPNFMVQSLTGQHVHPDNDGMYTIPETGVYQYEDGVFKLISNSNEAHPIGVDVEGHLVGHTTNEDPAVEYAELLLSSMKTWNRTPEDHRAETPRRFVSMLHEMTTPDPEFKFTTFDDDTADEMITLGPIPFYTLCAHHAVPFFGNTWIGYVPNGRLAGLSKFPRTVKHLAKGFWVQETLTIAIADFLEDKLDPHGVAVVMKAEHMCMAMRGVAQPGVITTTSAMRGVFADHSKTAKAEFMQGINGKH